MMEYLTALFLGFVEGLTEFIPVSSTGHLILLVEGLNFPAPPGHVFEVFIQIGAILAVMVLYRQKIIHTVTGLNKDPVAQKFALNIVIGTIPALVIGGLLHDFIKGTLYDPRLIAVTLILGGIIILLFEKKFRAPVMFLAVAYDLYKNWDAVLAYPDHGLMFAGLAASFVTALVVVKAVIGFISRHGFTPFAWYRIALGLVAIVIFF